MRRAINSLWTWWCDASISTQNQAEYLERLKSEKESRIIPLSISKDIREIDYRYL